ncbi:BCCT family transporter, partial [Desulfobulbus sp. AH-315-M07]|nr:BCCT family transporter [Desulfobulbus sp. AH-315-M07]
MPISSPPSSPNASPAEPRHWRASINPPVFFISGGIIVVLVVVAVALTDRAEALFKALLDFIATRFGWFYILSVGFFLFFALWLMLSRFGSIRLGDDDDRPQYSTRAWFAMLFSAGMGIGLVFFGVAEPIMHFANPPTGVGGSTAAAKTAMTFSYFHWGLHAWAIYVILGLAIAYFSFRKKLPMAIRSVLYPLLGDRIHGPMGHAVDILAVLGTVFGLATSLGLGAAQVNSGLNHLFGVEKSTTTQVIIIAVITAAATLSLVSGLDRGIKRLSELNMALASLLLIFVFIAGPTLFLLRLYADNIGNYLHTLVQTTFWAAPYDGLEWQTSWTLFYWGWWIAWAPFVGMFIARISRGRTIREFVLGVLLVPTLLTFFWFTVFGGTALHIELYGSGGISEAVTANVDTAIYEMLAKLPLGSISAFVAMVVVVCFFVTSSDSGSFVVDMLTSGGHPNPPVWQRVFWASTEGVVASVLL